MITVEEALKIVENRTISKNSCETVALEKALNMVLAEDVFSFINMPPFPQSAMDGYAINSITRESNLTVVGEVAAGEASSFTLKENEAVRIFTGAEVPESANMVVRQEDVEQNEGQITVKIFPKERANIRPFGEQIKIGQCALEKGHTLNEASVGFLASLGIETVTVYKFPKIAIISTGSELVEAGNALLPGQIYNSNSIMLQTALKAKGFENCKILKIKDNYKTTVNVIADCLNKYDLIICSGGISVGDYDFIGQALQENKVESHFYKVKQKPGKPLYFGSKGNAYVFGLPGNPAACLTCFYIYIFPFLNKYKGADFIGLAKYSGRLTKEYNRQGDRAEFLKGNVKDGNIDILDGQSSAMLQSFALANSIIYFPLGKSVFKAGDLVNYFSI